MAVRMRAMLARRSAISSSRSPSRSLRPLAFSAAPASSSQIDLAYTRNAVGDDVIVVWDGDGTFTAPTGTAPAVGAAFAGGTVLIVTHGGVLDLVYRRARGIPLGRPRDFPLPNASINWMTVDRDYWLIDDWGRTEHLGDDFVPLPFVVRV